MQLRGANTSERMLTIHQPNFIPRLKVLQKISAASSWVVFDRVQFARRDWQSRCQIRPLNKSNKFFWLSLDVHCPNGQSTNICELVLLETLKTKQRLKDSIRHSFRSSNHWKCVVDYWDEVEAILVSDSLSTWNMATTTVALKMFSKLPKIIASDKITYSGSGSQLIANICRSLNAVDYLADSGSTNYLDEKHFDGISLYWQHWSEPKVASSEEIVWRNLSFLSFLAEHGEHHLRDHLSTVDIRSYPPNSKGVL